MAWKRKEGKEKQKRTGSSSSSSSIKVPVPNPSSSSPSSTVQEPSSVQKGRTCGGAGSPVGTRDKKKTRPTQTETHNWPTLFLQLPSSPINNKQNPKRKKKAPLETKE